MHTGLLNTLFVLPVVMAYYGLKGVDLGSFFLLQGLFRVSVTALEIPTGYISDGWKRATSARPWNEIVPRYIGQSIHDEFRQGV